MAINKLPEFLSATTLWETNDYLRMYNLTSMIENSIRNSRMVFNTSISYNFFFAELSNFLFLVLKNEPMDGNAEKIRKLQDINNLILFL